MPDTGMLISTIWIIKVLKIGQISKQELLLYLDAPHGLKEYGSLRGGQFNNS